MEIKADIFRVINKFIGLLAVTGSQVSFADTKITVVPDVFVDNGFPRPAGRFSNYSDQRHVLVVEHDTDVCDGRYWMMFLETKDFIQIKHPMGHTQYLPPARHPVTVFYENDTEMVVAQRKMANFLLRGFKPQ